MAVPSLLFALLSPQAYEAVVRFVTRFVGEEEGGRAAATVRLAYLTDVALAALGLAVVIAAAPWISRNIIKEPGAVDLILVYTLGLCASAPISTSRSVLISFDCFAHVAKLASFSTLLRTALVLTLVAFGWGPEGVIYGSAAGLILEGIVMGLSAGRVLRTSTGYSWRSVRTGWLGADRRAIVSFMFYTEIISLVAVLAKQADVVLLGAARGPEAAGIYRLAWGFVTPVTRLTVPLQQVFYPRASRLAATRDWDGLQVLVRRQTARVGAPLAVVVLALIPVVMLGTSWIGGDEYRSAATPAALLLVGTAWTLGLFWIRPCFLAINLMRPLLVISTVAAALTLVGFSFAAHSAGATGVAAVRALGTGILGSGVSATYVVLWLRRRRTAHEVPVPIEGSS